jgi:hypothetical protein
MAFVGSTMQYRGIYYRIQSNVNPYGMPYVTSSMPSQPVYIGSGPQFNDHRCHGTVWFPTETKSLNGFDWKIAEFTMPLVENVTMVEQEMEAKLKRQIDKYLDNPKLEMFSVFSGGMQFMENIQDEG